MKKTIKSFLLIFSLLILSSTFSVFKADPPPWMWLDYHIEVDDNDVAHVVCEGFNAERCRVLLI